MKLATKFTPRRTADVNPFEEAFRAGFRNAELWTDASVLAEWEGVAALARHYPMEYVFHFPNAADLKPADLENAVRLYRGLGCRCTVLHPPMLSRYGEALRALLPDIRLAVENHGRGPEPFAAWLRNDWLTLDVEHLWMFTLPGAPLEALLEKVAAILREVGDRLRHVHMPGHLPGYGEHRPMYCSRDMVFGVFSLLAEAGYDGLVVSEADLEFQTPQDMRMDVLLFESWRARRERLPG